MGRVHLTRTGIVIGAMALVTVVLLGAIGVGVVDLGQRAATDSVREGDRDMQDQASGPSSEVKDDVTPSTSSGGGPGDVSSAATPGNEDQASGTASADGPSGNTDGGSASDGETNGSSGNPDDNRSEWCTGDGCIPESHLPILITEFSQKSDIIYNVPSRCVLQSDVTNDCTVPVRMRTVMSVSMPASVVSLSALRNNGKIVPMVAQSDSWLGSDYVLSSGEYGNDCTWVYTPTHKSEAFTFFMNFTMDSGTDPSISFISYDADTGRQIGQMETALLKVRRDIVVQTPDSGWIQWVYPTYLVNHVSAQQTINFHWQERAMASYTQIASTQTKFWIWGGAADVYILNGGNYEHLTPIIEYEGEAYYYLPEHHGDGWTQQSVTLKIVLLEPGVEYRLGIDSIDPITGYSISSFPGARWLFQT
ncbi:MAG: hypothetical protein JET69_04875 [Methanomassiliicoccales archaeon]|nr:hypothetical protein [Methanomassiliicoccales archaeon]